MKTIFGLCCQSCIHPKLSPKQTTTLTYLKKLNKNEQAPYLIGKAKINISNLKLLLQKSYENGIQAFRLSDSFIPMADLGLYDIQKYLGLLLQQAGKVANDLDMYLSCHPSQFFLLTSKNQEVIKTSIRNFNVFAKIISLMKLKHKPIVLTHVGAIKCWSNYQQACDVFCQNYAKMSNEAKQYFAVENDQTSHSINSCMYIHNKIGIPVVFDHAHYKYNPVEGISEREALKLALSTWKNGRIPKIHLCSQAKGVKIHNHADYIDVEDYLGMKNHLEMLGATKAIMMCEVKKKDEAILRLMAQLKNMQKASI